MTYTFYKSEGRQYSLGEQLDFTLVWKHITRNLLESIQKTPKINEHFYLELYDESGKVLRDSDELQLASYLFHGRLHLRTELIYVHHDYDESEHSPVMSNLASFEREKKSTWNDGDLVLKIHPLAQIGVDPTFLYELGDKYVRKL